MNLIKHAILAAVVFTCGGHAFAQNAPWPQKAVTIIMPGAPGSSADRVARLISEGLQKKWNTPVIIEYKSGAGGMIGAATVARSAPDGNTMLFGFTSVTLSPLLSVNPPYDIEKDLVAVSMVGYSPLALAVRADSKVKTVADFVSMAKAAGRPLTYGTFGVGTAYHINGETLKLAANIDMTVIPYKGEGPMLVDLLGGQVDSAIASVGLLAPQVAAGKVRALAVIEATRSRALPDVPTFAEAGYSQLNGSTWLGLFYPAKVPAPIVKKVSSDINEIISQPDVLASMRLMSIDTMPMKSDEFAEFLKSDIAKWKQMISNAKIPAR